MEDAGVIVVTSHFGLRELSEPVCAAVAEAFQRRMPDSMQGATDYVCDWTANNRIVVSRSGERDALRDALARQGSGLFDDDDGASYVAPDAITINAARAMAVPLHALMAFNPVPASRRRLVELLMVSVQADRVAGDSLPLGHDEGTLAVGTTGMRFLHLSTRRFSFRGSVWSSPRITLSGANVQSLHVEDTHVDTMVDMSWQMTLSRFKKKDEDEAARAKQAKEDAAKAEEEEKRRAEEEKKAGEGNNSGDTARQLLSWDGAGNGAGNGAEEGQEAPDASDGVSPLMPADVPRRKLLRIQSRDSLEAVFDLYWRSIAEVVREVAQAQQRIAAAARGREGGATAASTLVVADARISVFVHGKILSLAASKLARQYSNSTIIAFVPSEPASGHMQSLQEMQKALSLKNMVLMAGELSPQRVWQLARTPDLHALQLLGREVFNRIAMGAMDFVPYLGRLLSLAKSTVLELVPPSKLRAVMVAITGEEPDVVERRLRGLIRSALASVGIKNFSTRMLAPGRLGGFGGVGGVG